MKVIINKKNQTWESDILPYYSSSNSNNGQKLLFFGKPLLYDATAFNINLIENQTIENAIPRLTGAFFCMEIISQKVISFAIDFYGQTRLYMHENDEEIILCDSVFEFADICENEKYDYYQILYFLAHGEVWNEGTFFENIKILAPSKLYSLTKGLLNRKYLKTPQYDFAKSKLKDVMGDMLSGLSNANTNKPIALMFSGGKDSTFIARLMHKHNLDFKAFFFTYERPTFRSNISDEARASFLANKMGINFHNEKVDAYKVLKESIFEIVKNLPFDFHISIAQKSIIDCAKKQNCYMVLTGQNADSLYNLGSTGEIRPFFAIVKFIFGIYEGNRGYEVRELLSRYFQQSFFLNKLYNKSHNWLPLLLWKRINPSISLTVENLLNGFVSSANGMPQVELSIPFATTEGAKIYHNKNIAIINELMTTLDEGITYNVRDLMLRIKLLGHCQSRDVRCITEWAKNNGLDNCQVFSSAPVFSYLTQIKMTMKDVLHPKREIQNYLDNEFDYSSLQKELDVTGFDRDTLTSENQLFNSLFNFINKNDELNKYNNIALNAIARSPLFDINKIQRDIEKDSVLKYKMIWLGITLNTMSNKISNVQK